MSIQHKENIQEMLLEKTKSDDSQWEQSTRKQISEH